MTLLCVPRRWAAVPDLWETAAANLSRRGKSWHWPFDLTLPPAKAVWCLNVPASLFPFCSFCKKEVVTAAAVGKIVYWTVLPQAGRSWTSRQGLRASQLRYFKQISKSFSAAEKLKAQSLYQNTPWSNTSFITQDGFGAVLSSALHHSGDRWDILVRSQEWGKSARLQSCFSSATEPPPQPHGEGLALTNNCPTISLPFGCQFHTGVRLRCWQCSEKGWWGPLFMRTRSKSRDNASHRQVGPSQARWHKARAAAPCSSFSLSTANKHRVRFGINFKSSGTNCKAFSIL